MFAFENWHSALEMKLYIQRYIHHIGGLPDFTALRFTKYNQYESMILPMVKYLEGFGVQFHFGVQVVNVEFDCTSRPQGRQAASTSCRTAQASAIDLTENDLVFITNGGCVENSSMGSQNTPAPYNTEIKEPGGGWDMWRKIAAQDPAFGHPDKFCYDPEQTNWMSATVETLDQRIIPYITEHLQARPLLRQGRHRRHRHREGLLLAHELDHQPSAPVPRAAQGSLPGVGLRPVHRQARRLSSKSPCGSAPARKSAWSGSTTSVCLWSRSRTWRSTAPTPCPVMMPYIDAFFMPRAYGDRPKVVPDGAVNFAFLGQFAETPRDTIFTTEYSMRTGMEAVYTLLNIDRGVPEVWGSVYDVRDLLDATVKLRDGKKPIDMELNLVEKMALKKVLGKIEGTDLEKLLKEYHVI